MKKLVFLLLGLLFVGAAFSNGNNKVLLKEDFVNRNLPNWTNTFPDGMFVNNSNIAGGDALECVFIYQPNSGFQDELDGFAYLTYKNTISTKGFDSVYASFKYRFRVQSVSNKSFGIALRLKGQQDWTPLVTEVLSMKESEPMLVVKSFPAAFLDQETVEFCFFVHSPSADKVTYMIFFDDIYIDGIKENQAKVSLNIPTYSSDPFFALKGSIQNLGFPLDSCEISYKIDNGSQVYTDFVSFGPSVKNREVAQFVNGYSESQWATTLGSHTIQAWVSKVNGQPAVTSATDTSSCDFVVGTKSVPYRNLMEHFTSSTCPPCASLGKAVYNKLYPEINDKITLLKYQMHFPGAGDPYYIPDNGTRFRYYEHNAVPSQSFNGKLFVSSGTYSEDSAVLNGAINANPKTCFEIDVKSALILGSGVATIDFDVKSYAALSNAKLQVVVYENETFKNKSSNGETSFNNVVMKMLPDAEGTSVNYEQDSTYSYTFSYDMTTTNAEELNDLSVAIFIQEVQGKNIIQSATTPITTRDAFVASVGNVDLPTVIGGLQIPILGEVSNGGKNLTSFEVSYDINGVVKSQSFTANLAVFEKSFFSFENHTVPAAGKYTLKLWVSKINGLSPDLVDTLTKEITCIESQVPYMPLLEEFASSTSVPSAKMNAEVVDPLYKDFSSKMNLIKYPVGTDPYTQRSNTNRAKKYGVDKIIPSLILQGLYVQPEDSLNMLANMLKTKIEAFGATKSIVDITTASTPIVIYKNNNRDTVKGQISLVSPQSGTYRLYCFLIEKETSGNKKANGEKVFTQQVMRMIGGDNGVDAYLIANEPFTYNFKEGAGGFIEEYSDLVFVAYVVDETNSRKYVMQSAQFNVNNEVSNFEEKAVETFAVYPNPAKEKVNISISEMSDLRVFDAMGRLVYSKNRVSQDLELEVGSFSKGVYTIRLISNDKTKISKLTVIK